MSKARDFDAVAVRAEAKARAVLLLADVQRQFEDAVVWAVEHDNRQVTEVAKVAGMSRKGIYDLLARRRSA